MASSSVRTTQRQFYTERISLSSVSKELGQIVGTLEHIGSLARMSVSEYRGRRYEPRQQNVVSLSKTLYPHCFSRLSCEMSTRWGQPREGCSVL